MTTAPLNGPAEAPAATVSGYMEPAPMGVSEGHRRISAEE